MSLMFLGALAFGCSTEPRTPDAVSGNGVRHDLDDNTIAIVGNSAISKDALRKAMKDQADLGGKQASLEKLVEFNLLLEQAKANGLHEDPVLRHQFENMVVSKFLEAQLAEREANLEPISEGEIQAYYDAHLGRYQSPQRYRGGILFLSSPRKATPEKLKEGLDRAIYIHREAVLTNDIGFRMLTQKHSEDRATRYQGGDTGWLTQTDPTFAWETQVIEALFALKEKGEVAPLISTDRGHYIVRLSDVLTVQTTPLAEVEEGIRYQLEQQRRQEIQATFMAEMRSGMRIEINQALLESIPESSTQIATKPPQLPAQ